MPASATQLRPALARYGDALAQKAASSERTKDLVELDHWFRTELRTNIQARSPAHLTQKELSKIVKWKLSVCT